MLTSKDSNLLSYPFRGSAGEIVAQSLWRREILNSVRNIEVNGACNLRFEPLLHYFAGPSVRRIHLFQVSLRYAADLVYALSRMPNLVDVSVSYVRGLNDVVFCSISEFAGLSALVITGAVLRSIDRGFRLLADDSCRSSLRSIDLRGSGSFEDR